MVKSNSAKQKNDAYRAWRKERAASANLALGVLMELPEPTQEQKDSADKVFGKFMSVAYGKQLKILQGK